MRTKTRGRLAIGAALAVALALGGSGVAVAQSRTLADVQEKQKHRFTPEQRTEAIKRREEARARAYAKAKAGAKFSKKPAASASGQVSTLAATPAGGFAPALDAPLPGGVTPGMYAPWPDPFHATTQGGPPDYFGTTNWAFSPPLRKFVDRLPGVGPGGANNLGQYLSVGKPDTITYPGSDYYEIEVREYEERMHSDLPPTRLRGYVQVNKGTDANGVNTLVPDPIHYLGPTLLAQRDRPVRIKFTNRLPAGEGGNLFIPTDTTVMGAGMGPLLPTGTRGVGTPCDPAVQNCAQYPQNRAELHLHGGRTPWISDGTPHQWITPVEENTPYPRGVSVSNVPDMPDPGDGSQTYYYTNQQSARLLFYHDHAYGITRLNVYVGEAAGYIIQDPEEHDLVNGGIIPALGIPLVIQDKTFVDPTTVLKSDPTWNWGTGEKDPFTGYVTPKAGDLWYPHVYSPVQNPYDISGWNTFGRWHYGPWFWPPTQDIAHGPIPNPYYEGNPDLEPFEIPGTPNPSIPGESFFDTMLVNGTAFPHLDIDPKTYRFRILNAANDRVVNLQLYVADPSFATTFSGRTEVRMVPSIPTETFPDYWVVDNREGGVPDPLLAGPDWIQIATEAGFLAAPVKIKTRPIEWNRDPTTFNFGNVKGGSLIVAPGERADVVVDFSKFAGKTLILYNDAPAPFPASETRVDHYSGHPDLTDSGGNVTTAKGYGPNTRTIMQIRVANKTPAPEYDFAALEGAFASQPGQPGTFVRSQDPLIVAQSLYDSAYGATFPKSYPYWGYSRIGDTTLSFKTIDGKPINAFPMQPKAIHDEMGAAYDKEYGRMSGKLGLTTPNPNSLTQNFNLQNYVDPVTEIIGAEFVAGVVTAGDSTQIWKITHNGVDTHPIHFHAFDVQVVNRVGWDNQIRLPEPNERGWKDTVRISPLEDTIVALRPMVPQVPFGVPDSIRPLSPAQPPGSIMGFSQIDPVTGGVLAPPNQTTNVPVNFGWEFVWHCHILSHEEDDMMRPISMYVPSIVPAAPVLSAFRAGPAVLLRWTDATAGDAPSTIGNMANEIGFVLERSPDGGTWTQIAAPLANQTDALDPAGTDTDIYRVIAWNAAGQNISNTATVGGVLPPALDVTLEASHASPTPQGTAVTFTAAGQGGTPGSYTYRFSLSGDFGLNWSVVQDFSPVASWVLPGTAFVGTYRVKVEVGTGLSGAQASATLDHVVRAPLPASVTLTADRPSPQVAGASVTFTGACQGVEADLCTYRFSLDEGSGFQVVQSYGPATTYVLPSSKPIGSYVVKVDTRTSPLTDSDASATLPFVLTAPAPKATGVLLEVNLPSPQLQGTVVTFTATGQGPESIPASQYQYRFLLKVGAGAWQAVQGFGPLNTWTLPTDVAGVYYVAVEVRTALTGTRDAISPAITFGIGLARATGVLLSASPPSPQVRGTDVTFTAVGQGPAFLLPSDYQYRFSISADGVSWTMARDWGSDTWVMTGAAAGTYRVAAEARVTPGGPREAISAALVYNITLPKATGVLLQADRNSPQPYGTAVLFTATGQGPAPLQASDYQYRFVLSANNGAWTEVRAWGPGNTWLMPATQAGGSYKVAVEVRTANAGARDAISDTLAMNITPPKATGVTLSGAPLPGHVQVGQSVTFTATGSGVPSYTPDNYQYRFLVKTGTTWAAVTGWGGRSYTTSFSPAGLYYVAVEVKANPAATARDAISASLRYEAKN